MNKPLTSQQAILVLGPESSGTRLVTSIFIAAGCTGDDGHGQRFDLRMPHEPRVVWRRSYPHYHDWPDAREYIRRLRAANYDVSVAVTSRDWHCMACSQADSGHAESREAAFANLRRAYREIFAALTETDAPFVVTSYESIVGNGKPAVDRLLQLFDLPAVSVPISKHFLLPAVP